MNNSLFIAASLSAVFLSCAKVENTMVPDLRPSRDDSANRILLDTYQYGPENTDLAFYSPRLKLNGTSDEQAAQISRFYQSATPTQVQSQEEFESVVSQTGLPITIHLSKIVVIRKTIQVRRDVLLEGADLVFAPSGVLRFEGDQHTKQGCEQVVYLAISFVSRARLQYPDLESAVPVHIGLVGVLGQSSIRLAPLSIVSISSDYYGSSLDGLSYSDFWFSKASQLNGVRILAKRRSLVTTRDLEAVQLFLVESGINGFSNKKNAPACFPKSSLKQFASLTWRDDYWKYDQWNENVLAAGQIANKACRSFDWNAFFDQFQKCGGQK